MTFLGMVFWNNFLFYFTNWNVIKCCLLICFAFRDFKLFDDKKDIHIDIIKLNVRYAECRNIKSWHLFFAAFLATLSSAVACCDDKLGFRRISRFINTWTEKNMVSLNKGSTKKKRCFKFILFTKNSLGEFGVF